MYIFEVGVYSFVDADFAKGNNSREKNIGFVEVEARLEVKIDSIFLFVGGEGVKFRSDLTLISIRLIRERQLISYERIKV